MASSVALPAYRSDRSRTQCTGMKQLMRRCFPGSQGMGEAASHQQMPGWHFSVQSALQKCAGRGEEMVPSSVTVCASHLLLITDSISWQNEGTPGTVSLFLAAPPSLATALNCVCVGGSTSGCCCTPAHLICERLLASHAR